MVVAVRAEAVITAQNKLKPGLASAARELSRFQAMQTKATAAFTATAARVGAAAQQRISAASAAMAAVARSQAVTLGGPAALAASYKKFADVDRQITRIGLTANASAEDLAGVRKEIEGIAYETAQSSGGVTTGLNVLVSQGRSLQDAMSFLPSVARTAAATGSAVDDIAKSADSVSTNFKIAGKDMQGAFDIMSEGGKAGQFELPDMARYIPSLGPATAAIGFSGEKGLADLVAMLQVMRKGSGTAEEAVSSMNNILTKMESDKTTKGFKALGVDSEKAFAKARKEGANLVEVFENLLHLALKGDKSKLGEIIDDQEFKRGALALMTYRGEWQKTSKTIRRVAPGSVARDLSRVTNDARAQLDRMFSAIENRAVQIGGAVAKHLVLPLEEAVKKIERGENATVNRVESAARDYNANVIAKSELDTGHSGTYDPAFRKAVDERKEKLQRERIEQERGRLGTAIGGLQGDRQKVVADAEAEKAGKKLPPWVAKTLDAKTKLRTDEIDARLAGAQLSLARLDALVSIVDNLKSRVGENTAAAAAAAQPRISRPTDAPGFARVGSGPASFAPTLGGGGAIPMIQFGGKPISAAQPPVKPASLSGKAADATEVTKALPALAGRMADFVATFPQLPAKPLDEVERKVSAVATSFGLLGPAAQTAGSAMASGVGVALTEMQELSALISRVDQQLKGLRVPNLRPGLGGFDTGRQGPN